MIDVRQTAAFKDWFASLGDLRARAHVLRRIERLTAGNYGDHKFFDGIGELRIDYGPGYRIYLVKRGAELVVLLGGGTKKGQDADIKRAKKLAKEI